MSLALIACNRSSKTMRRGNDLVAPAREIPLDVLIEIMTRLPAKSLMRFKCLSKLWSFLIRSRNFSNRYFTVASPRRPPRLYISLVDHLGCGSMELCNNPHESLLLSLKPSSTAFDLELTMQGIGGHNMVILRGLILYIVCTKACIYNPTTRQSLNLPAVKSTIFSQKRIHKNVLYFFGHDPVLDQYKVVCTVVTSSKYLKRITSEHWVFVLEVGGSWKRIQFHQPHFPTGTGLCINGVIYYLAYTALSREIVVSFDIRCEKFSMIQVPHVVSEFADSAGFIEYAGKPAIFDHTNLGLKGNANLWVLEDAAKWSTKSLLLQPCQMHLLDNSIRLMVRGTTQNGQVILAPCELRSPFYILYYDLHKNDLSKVEIKGIPHNGFSNSHFFFKLMDKSESIMHLET